MKTVRVPAEMEPAFAAAEATVSSYFRQRRDAPEQGTIEISGERYLLVRAASLSVEFFQLVRGLYGEHRMDEADAFARNILFDLAHSIGKSDARTFHAKMGLTDPIARLSAGPVHFSHTGWAFVDISAESRPTPDEHFHLLYDHPYSFESDAWRRADKTATFPVCIMNAGYSSGWCTESFGVGLVASEVQCRGRGDPSCRFVMAPPAAIERHVEAYARTARGRVPLERVTIPDFFARKRMEDELRKSKDELELRVEERTRELAAANEQLRREIAEREEVERRLRQTQKLEAVGRLAGGIAHDFNNLINVVIGRSERLRRGLDPGDPVAVQLGQITAAGERAAALTQQLLAFSTTHFLKHEDLDLNVVVRELGQILLPLIGENIAFVMDLAADAGGVHADRSQIEQLVINLAVNARDAMPDGGRLAITTARVRLDTPQPEPGLPAGDYVRLSVTDSGGGMTAETLAHLFEPFFTTKDGKGTGLGLATVYTIARQLGGTVDVDSAPDAGARFEVMLPRITAPPAMANAPRSHAVAVPERVTVLLVEDLALLRTAIRDLLRDEGYVVLEAEDPEAALAVAASATTPIQLLITDVVMPGIGGRELASRLRAQLPALRVLFISGYTADAGLAAELRAGATSFLAKPFTPEQLAAKLRELL